MQIQEQVEWGQLPKAIFVNPNVENSNSHQINIMELRSMLIRVIFFVAFYHPY